MINNNKIAVIHIAKAQTCMTETKYRDMLSSVGVQSSKDLTFGKFKKIMKQFESLGFKNRSTNQLAPTVSKARLLGKIKAMSADMELNTAYVDAIARRMFGIDKYIWCDADQLRRITAALVYKKRKEEMKI